MLSRFGHITVVVSTVCAGLTARSVRSDLHAVRQGPFTEACTSGLNVMLLAISVWIVVVVALPAVAPGTASVLAWVTPTYLAALCTSIGAATCVAAPALATPPEYTLDGLRSPDRPDGAPARQMRTPASRPDGGTVTVAPGDCLWNIAARRLPAAADARSIAASVSAWHQHNRSVIGSDPHLIFPGQKLNPPPGKDNS